MPTPAELLARVLATQPPNYADEKARLGEMIGPNEGDMAAVADTDPTAWQGRLRGAGLGDFVAPYEALAPAPDTTYGTLLPIARDNASGDLRLALPTMARDVATGWLDMLTGMKTGEITPAASAALQATGLPMASPSGSLASGGALRQFQAATPYGAKTAAQKASIEAGRQAWMWKTPAGKFVVNAGKQPEGAKLVGRAVGDEWFSGPGLMAKAGSKETGAAQAAGKSAGIKKELTGDYISRVLTEHNLPFKHETSQLTNGTPSQYWTINKNGQKLKIRLSDHIGYGDADIEMGTRVTVDDGLAAALDQFGVKPNNDAKGVALAAKRRDFYAANRPARDFTPSQDEMAAEFAARGQDFPSGPAGKKARQSVSRDLRERKAAQAVRDLDAEWGKIEAEWQAANAAVKTDPNVSNSWHSASEAINADDALPVNTLSTLLAKTGSKEGGAAQAAGKSLPMDEASRMARANDLGFTVDAYKGAYPYDPKSGPIYAFKNGKFQQVENIGAELTPLTSFNSPNKPYAGFFGGKEVANKFAEAYAGEGSVFPVKLKLDNPLIIEAGGKPAGAFQFKEMADKAGTRAGFNAFHDAFTDASKYDGVILRNTVDEGTIYVPKSSNQIRSRFANFDPAKADSADLMASRTGTPELLAALLQQQQPPRGDVNAAWLNSGGM